MRGVIWHYMPLLSLALFSVFVAQHMWMGTRIQKRAVSALIQEFSAAMAGVPFQQSSTCFCFLQSE